MKTLRNTLFGLLFTLALIALPAVAFAQGDGTYTDRYWQLANAPANKNPDFANYTERYWDMAAEHKTMMTVSDPAEGTLSELDSQFVMNFSDDDVYDFAAGALSAPNPQIVMNFSGDDTYDLAADGQPTKAPVLYVNRFSGDDTYDSAAGGLFYEPTVRYVSNFSGDDAYDPTFDWTPHQVQVAQAPVR